MSVADQLAEALLWKMAHPIQHSSSMDEALLSYLETDPPPEIAERIRGAINTRREDDEPKGPRGARRDHSVPGGTPLAQGPPEAMGKLFG